MEANNEEKKLHGLDETIQQKKEEIRLTEELEKLEKQELKDLEKLKEIEEAYKIERIFVNGKEKAWVKKKIDLQQVIILAYGTYHADWTNTVAYEDGPKENPEGSLKLGQEIDVKNKMIFHATATFNS